MTHSETRPSHKREEPTDGGRVHWSWLFSRPGWVHVLVGLICVLLGFALSAQVRSQDADPIGRMDQADLVGLLADLEQREQDLTTASNQLQTQINELEDAANSAQAAQEAADKANRDALIVAGAIPVKGPGVTLNVIEGTDPLPASVFVTTMAEFRNGGSEALALNGVRLAGRSWFNSGPGGITVDGVKISSPYVWSAIGDPQTLETALDIRGGAAAQFRAFGAAVEVVQYNEITIEAVTSPIEPQWAKIVDGQ